MDLSYATYEEYSASLEANTADQTPAADDMDTDKDGAEVADNAETENKGAEPNLWLAPKKFFGNNADDTC